jgi:multidrug efflux pump subunit AcrB
MKNITAFALENSRLVVTAVVGIIVAGAWLFSTFPKLEDPSITIREAVVVTTNAGMPVRQVERLITRPVEEALRTMGEVEDIKDSTSTRGKSLIHVSIRDEVPEAELPMVWKKLRNKMSDLEPSLPQNTNGPFVNDSFGDTAVATIALWTDGFSMAEMYEAARSLRERLNVMDGVQKIEMTGEQEERIYIEMTSAKLAQYGLDAAAIFDTLAAQNVQLPSGHVLMDGMRAELEVQGRFTSIMDIEETLIPVEGAASGIPLRDLASVRRGYADPVETPAYYNGRQAIVLSVFLQKGVDAVDFGRRLKSRVAELENGLPIGYKLDFATFQPTLIEKAVGSMVGNVLQSVAIVLTVVMLLLGLRTGLIVGSFIPLVMLFGIVMMRVFGIEMQRTSLATMIIALGMFVDNAIVVSDDVRVRLMQGAAAKDAALAAGASLSLPLLTSTLTTVLAFGPILMQNGSVGDYTESLGSVMAILLLGSWFFSMFSMPSVCAWFMKRPGSGEAAKDPYQGRFFRLYRRILAASLRRKGLVLASAGAVFALSLYGFTLIPMSFFPDSDRNQFLIYVDLPAGTDISQTDGTVREISAWLQDERENPEITGTIAYVGDGGPRFFLSLSPVDPAPCTGFIVVNTLDGDQVPGLIRRVRAHLLDHFPNVRARVNPMFLGPGEPGLVEVRLSGPGEDVLLSQAEALMAALRDVPGTINVRHDWRNLVPLGTISLDQARARRAGVTTKDVADSLQAFMEGTTASLLADDNVEIPIVGRGAEEDRDTLSNLPTTGVYSQATGTIVPLNQVTDLGVHGEPSRIVRYNQERTVTVSASNTALKASELFERIRPTLEAMDFPAGHFWEVGGEIEASDEALGNLGKWVPLCLGCMFVLLIWQFNSFRRAGIIMLTIPLILVGAEAGLFIMGADFGFMVFLGLLALAGSIVNNGIVLIDRIETNRKEGQPPLDAVLDAAVSRFRPILLSVSTTMLGFTPLIIGRDPLFYDMACAMFFGLGVGSVFTLSYVPALYALLFKVDTRTASGA